MSWIADVETGIVVTNVDTIAMNHVEIEGSETGFIILKHRKEVRGVSLRNACLFEIFVWMSEGRSKNLGDAWLVWQYCKS